MGYWSIILNASLLKWDRRKSPKYSSALRVNISNTLFIDGPTPKAVLDRYTRFTGRPALPPAWSFGLWLTTSFTTNYDEATVNSFIDGMAERNLPLHVFHFDCFWMKAFQWCDFEWDPLTFPDPEGMIRRLKAKGLKICVWINPYIGQKSPVFKELQEKGLFTQTPGRFAVAVG